MPEQKKPSIFSSPVFDVLKHRGLAYKTIHSREFPQLRRQNPPDWRILSYERICNPETLPFPVPKYSYTRPDTFEQHLQYLITDCRPIALSELLHLLDNYEEVPPKSVALTFDGGHSCNYEIAAPLLQKYQIPASFFFLTSYPNTTLLLYDDELNMLLQVLQEQKQCLPSMPFLEPDIIDRLRQTSPKAEITAELVSALKECLNFTSEENRLLVIATLRKELEDYPFPMFRDFMSWEEIRQMSAVGFDFGSMGHMDSLLPPDNPHLFSSDYAESLKAFQAQNVPMLKFFCFNRGKFSAAQIYILRALGMRFALTLDQIQEPRFQTKLPMMLSRTVICEGLAFCQEVFGCRMWNIKVDGVQF